MSGGGSTEAATDELSQRLLRFLVRFGTSTSRPGLARNRLSLLDVGCGWGEWLPTLLRRAVERRMLPAKVFYHGLDIAQRPIRFLRQHFGGCSGACDASFHFTALDACTASLPSPLWGYSVVVVRHVFQHLSIKDALGLLKNLGSLRPVPRFLLLSSWPQKQNRDLDAYGGSSAFSFVSPTPSQGFRGYDLRKPPFRLRPLCAWPEKDGELLVLQSRALRALGR